MSVLLEGKITKDIISISSDHTNTNTNSNHTESLSWKGVWQFIRDRNAKVDFRYTWKSNEVPNELIDYVSFEKKIEDDWNGNGNGVNGNGDDIPKRRGRGRGRKKKIDTGAPVVGVDTSTVVKLESDESQSQSIKEEKIQEVLEIEEDIQPEVQLQLQPSQSNNYSEESPIVWSMGR